MLLGELSHDLDELDICISVNGHLLFVGFVRDIPEYLKNFEIKSQRCVSNEVMETLLKKKVEEI